MSIPSAGIVVYIRFEPNSARGRRKPSICIIIYTTKQHFSRGIFCRWLTRFPSQCNQFISGDVIIRKNTLCKQHIICTALTIPSCFSMHNRFHGFDNTTTKPMQWRFTIYRFVHAVYFSVPFQTIKTCFQINDSFPILPVLTDSCFRNKDIQQTFPC